MRKRICSIIIATALLSCLLSACGSKPAAEEPPVTPTEEQTNLSNQTPTPQPPVQKQKDEAQPAASGETADASQEEYDFSQPVPESEAVDNSYFEDAAFIGDSRTDGFLVYSGIGCGENLTSNGLSIFKLAEKKAITIDGNQYTLLEALALKQYGKVYLSLGINELGYYDDQGFYDSYCQAIDLIRECQPNAVIYLQGLIPLNEDVIAETGGASYLKNDHLLVYNDLMKKAAEEKQVAFLDLNPVFADENGQLPRDASADGVHLRKAYCQQWLEYLQTHTVSYETLYPSDSSSQSQPAASSAQS